MKRVAIVRGKFLNRYEMQFFEPLTKRYDITAFSSLTPFHDRFAFPVVKLPSPMDVPDVPYKMPILNRLFTDAHYLFGLEDTLRGFDLVHTAETYYRYTQQALDAKKRGYVKKVIATVLETIPGNNEGIHGRREYKARARRELDHIIALTHKTKHALITEGADADKISVISHFVDTHRFAPRPGWLRELSRPSKRSFTVLFVGRLEVYKGIYDVIDAIGQLTRHTELGRRHVRIVVVGDGSKKHVVERKACAFGKNWHFTLKSATYDQMPEIYRNADIFVAPSKPTPTWEEQYCTALLEAQASGLPIVTTHTGGIPENVGKAAIIVPSGDVSAIAAALGDFLLHAKKREQFGRMARQRAVSHHDIRIGARKLSDLYETVLNT